MSIFILQLLVATLNIQATYVKREAVTVKDNNADVKITLPQQVTERLYVSPSNFDDYLVCLIKPLDEMAVRRIRDISSNSRLNFFHSLS